MQQTFFRPVPVYTHVVNSIGEDSKNSNLYIISANIIRVPRLYVINTRRINYTCKGVNIPAMGIICIVTQHLGPNIIQLRKNTENVTKLKNKNYMAENGF